MPSSLVGTRIREARKSQKISQTALAAQVGISASYLNLIEHNRRRIAGKTLNALAHSLNLNPSALSETADAELINQLQQAAATFPQTSAEAARVMDFVGRFPGYADLVRTLFERQNLQRENLLALSDKIGNDPYFAEAIHLLLSSVTTIRSTSELLRDHRDMSQSMMDRFVSNLHQESVRLSKTATDVLDYFETEEKTPPSEPLSELSNPNDSDLQAPSTDMTLKRIRTETPDPFAQSLATERFQSLNSDLDAQAFLDIARAHDFDPERISVQTSHPLQDVLFRLAHLDISGDDPDFGYLQVDAAGGVIHRKRLPSFSLPRNSSACSLWPIYTAFGQPMRPIKTMMDLPTGERLLAFAYANYTQTPIANAPGVLNATMIFTEDYASILPKSELANLNTIPVGVQCAVCPRKTCAARRAANILS